MKHAYWIMMIACIAFLGWRMGDTMSRDAIILTLGIVFGILASIPAMLMVVAGRRRDERYGDTEPQMTHNHFHVYTEPTQSQQIPVQEWKVIEG